MYPITPHRSITYSYSDLVPAIQTSEAFRTKMAQFPPPTAGRERENKSFAKVMDETVGFTDLNNEWWASARVDLRVRELHVNFDRAAMSGSNDRILSLDSLESWLAARIADD